MKTFFQHDLQHRLNAWPHKAPKIGIGGNQLLKLLQRQPMGKMAINRLPQKACLGPLIFPNRFLRLDNGLYHITAAGADYLEQLRAAGLLE